jgi:NAD(P)H-flavin reductase
VTANLTTAQHRSPPMMPSVVRVRDFQKDSPDVFTLAVEPPAGFRFSPGQFNMLYVFGVGEAAISLCGDAADTSTILHTIRGVGSVTNALARLGPGSSVGARGPFGSAWPLEEARGHDVVIVAGGIGLPPLRPMIYHILRNRNDYGRLVLLYGARTPVDILYPAELEQWRNRGDFQILTTVDRADSSWTGAVGVVTGLFATAEFDPARTIGMMCGPEIMMRFAIRELAQRGVTDDRVYVSLERNMQCAVGFCGHCQFGPEFICLNGPVFRYDRIKHFFLTREA